MVSVQLPSSHWACAAGKTLPRIRPHRLLLGTKAGDMALNRRREPEPLLMCDLHHPPSTVTIVGQQG